MRTKLRVSFALLPVAGAGAVAGVVALSSSGAPSAPRPDQVTALAPAAAPTAAPANGKDPEESTVPPKAAHVGAPAAGGRMTDADGDTVYTFSSDKPGVSTCTGACSKTWIPVRSPSGKPQPSNGLPASALGSMQRPDGSQQVTLYRMPLYYYAADNGPGAATGQGRSAFGGTWTADAPPAPPSKGSAPASPTK